MAKAAVDSFTRQAALEFGPLNIRVCGVAPGPIAGTPGMRKLSAKELDGGDDTVAASELDAFRDRVPLGRVGYKHEIALACVFLASDAARFISGDTLIVDGGAVLARPRFVPENVYDAFQAQRRAKNKAKL